MHVGRTLSFGGAAVLSSIAALALTGSAAAQHPGSMRVRGVVTSVSSDGFEILLPNTSREEIATTHSTRYSESGTPDAPRGMEVGDNAAVQLMSSSVPTASSVEILLDSARGKVMSIDGSSILLSSGRNRVRQVRVTPTTKYFAPGGSTVSGVTDGEQVVMYGMPVHRNLRVWFVDARGAVPEAPTGSVPPPATPTGTSSTTTTTSPVVPSIPTVPPSTTSTTTSIPGPDVPPGFQPGGPMQ